MNPDEDPAPDPDEPVGAVLARMRRARGISGRKLGEMVQMSQPKVSRLENGVGLPDPVDVAKLASALGADEDEVRRLESQAARLHNRMADWRQSPVGLAQRQLGIGKIEELTEVFRIFQPTIVIGLLQTSDYARSILTSYQRFAAVDVSQASPAVIAEAVSERLKRQVVLSDPTKSFRLIMTETVLNNRIGPPDSMPAQIRRLREVAQQENVFLGIIPADTQWSLPPYHGFALLDDRHVMVDLVNTGLTSHGESDLRLYRQVFDELEGLAVTDIDEILDKYTNEYLDLARPRARPRPLVET